MLNFLDTFSMGVTLDTRWIRKVFFAMHIIFPIKLLGRSGDSLFQLLFFFCHTPILFSTFIFFQNLLFQKFIVGMCIFFLTYCLCKVNIQIIIYSKSWALQCDERVFQI
jgi:hypothetical protein